MSFKVETVPSPKVVISTRCHWDEQKQSVYYVDVAGVIFRYDYRENKVYSATIDGEPSTFFIIPIAGRTDEYAIGLGRRCAIVHWDGKSNKATVKSIAFEVDQGKEDNIFNAAKADPTGRFYGGTMRSPDVGDILEVSVGAFYKYTKAEGVTKLLSDVCISNGMAWNEKEKKLFYIDSGKFTLKEFDWNPTTGDISNERLVRDFSINGQNPGYLPDGLTIDTDGNLYVTTFEGSKIFKVEPKTGKILLEIPFPVKKVTAVTFGGPALDTLFVTTASKDDADIKDAGLLFKVTGLGAKGFPGVRVRL